MIVSTNQEVPTDQEMDCQPIRKHRPINRWIVNQSGITVQKIVNQSGSTDQEMDGFSTNQE